jgi:hypothetical protein
MTTPLFGAEKPSRTRDLDDETMPLVVGAQHHPQRMICVSASLFSKASASG